MHLFKISSLSIRHIENFDMRLFLYLFIKLNGFFNFCFFIYSINCKKTIYEGNVFFQHL